MKTRWSGIIPCRRSGENNVAASIDTPLHAFLPFPHVDHLHPDWAIAIAASANGKEKLEEFNKTFGHNMSGCRGSGPALSWRFNWSRPSKTIRGATAVLLGSHGLFTWGNTQRDCYLEQHSHHRPDGRVHPRGTRRRRDSLFGGTAA